MDERDWLSERFEGNRTHLRAVAYRMLGSLPEAEDAVQEAWLRLSRADTSGVENLGGWLTTVVARVCLDMLRSRKSKREEPLDDGDGPDTLAGTGEGLDPESEALLATSVGPALLVVLETLAPAERVAFVLHDMFDLSFEEIAKIVNRTPTAARQLASRARRRVRGTASGPDAERAGLPGDAGEASQREGGRGDEGQDDRGRGDRASVHRARQREVVEALLAASRGGNFDALLALLDPDVVVRADATAVSFGAKPEVRGANSVLETFLGRARAAQPALLDGLAGIVWAPSGQVRVAFSFTVDEAGKIVEIHLAADPDHIGRLNLEILGPAAE